VPEESALPLLLKLVRHCCGWRGCRERYGKRVIDLAVRFVLDQGITSALWGARRPDQLNPVEAAMRWSQDAAAKQEINRILAETIADPVGPEFMAPPEWS
jgi:aryl-alcohol dehydrogenase-like predicted oxidoreductase